MLRVYFFQHIFNWSIRRVNSGTGTGLFVEFYAEIGWACIDLTIFKTRKEVPVSSRKIERVESFGFLYVEATQAPDNSAKVS